MPDIVDDVCLPSIFLARCQTFVDGVTHVMDDTYSRQEFLFAALMVRRALARSRLNLIKFSFVGCFVKIRKAFFLSLMALQHSKFHHGTGIRRGFVDVCGIAFSAAVTRDSVIFVILESTFIS
jgi:hypothetical protein